LTFCVQTDTDAIEEHFAAPRKMDRKAAGELFDLLVPSIIDKLDRGTQLKNDLKEVIDDVAQEFGDPPLDIRECIYTDIDPGEIRFVNLFLLNLIQLW
jgi:hypothetical protein